MSVTIAHAISRLCPAEIDDFQYKAIELLAEAQEGCAIANAGNASNSLAAAYASAGLPLQTSIIASIMAFGGTHAPVELARSFLAETLGDDPALYAQKASEELTKTGKLPGYGNSFHKTGIDPNLEALAQFIHDHRPDLHARIFAGYEALANTGKQLYPNPAAYTAIVAEMIGLPKGLELIMLIMPRMPVWASIWNAERK